MRGKGKGSTRKLDNGKWECIVQSQYINPDSKGLNPKRIKRTGKTEKEAQKNASQALLAWEKDFERTLKNNKVERNRSFGSYMEEFIETEVKPYVSASTYKSYIYTMRANFFNYKISKLSLKSLSTVEFEVFFDALLKKKSEKTVSFPVQLCRRCCDWLVAKSLISENYAMDAKTKRKKRDEYFRAEEDEKRTRKEVFSREDIAKFYHAYKNNMSEYCPAIIIMLETMMRGQELLALTIDDIDFEQNIIHIRSALSERFVDNDKDKGIEKYIKVPKNGKEREIYMTPLAREAVEYIIHQTALKCRDNPQKLLFPSYLKHGKIRSMDAFEIQFKDLCNKLGIDRDVHVSKTGYRSGLNVHALRHTAITIANTAPGANVINTALMAGHTSIRTENIYTHTNIDALKSVQTAGSTVLNIGDNSESKEMRELTEVLNKNGIQISDLLKYIDSKQKG